jgi:hypothetical protein
MAIAKKPKSNHTDIAAQAKEEAADYFIAGAEPEDKAVRKEKKIPILVRFDRDMLKRVDGAAKRRGVSRSAWIHFMVSRSLEQEEA